MATFGELQTRVERRVIDLPTTVQNEVPTLINEAVRTLQDLHNFKVMEAETSELTTTVGQRSIGNVPSDFKSYRGSPYLIKDNGDTRDIQVAANRTALLDFFDVDPDVDEDEPLFLLDGEPLDEDGTREWEVFPFPDGNSDYSDGEYRIKVPYWKYLPELSGDADTNWFTEYAVEFIVRSATAEAFFLDWDEERGALWEQRATAKFQQVINTDKRFRMSPVRTLAIHKDVNDPKLRW